MHAACPTAWRGRVACSIAACIGLALCGVAGATGVRYSWVYANPRFVEGTATPANEEPLDYTHMGMLAVLPDGRLAAAWQGAPVFWEGSSQQGIYWAASADSGRTWGSPQLAVAPEQGVPIWAPVLHVQGNATWLFYSESRPQCTWQGEGGTHWGCGGDLKRVVSTDCGRIWGPPQVVLSYDSEGGIAKMVANRLAVAPDGAWLLPFWREMGGAACSARPQLHGRAGVLLSANQGGSWQAVNVALSAGSPPTWLIEATISGRGAAGGWAQLFRTQVGRIYASFSEDGRAWSAAAPLPLPNPNSKVDSLALPSGLLLLAYNDSPSQRTPLALAASADGGRSWRRLLALETDPRGSFSYPTLLYHAATEEVLVIYSVAYPPGYTPPRPGGWWLRLQQRLRRPFTSAAAGRRDAWGFDAYGLRLAAISAAKLDLLAAGA